MFQIRYGHLHCTSPLPRARCHPQQGAHRQGRPYGFPAAAVLPAAALSAPAAVVAAVPFAVLPAAVLSAPAPVASLLAVLMVAALPAPAPAASPLAVLIVAALSAPAAADVHPAVSFAAAPAALPAALLAAVVCAPLPLSSVQGAALRMQLRLQAVHLHVEEGTSF